jgi:serine/threonine protein kinase
VREVGHGGAARVYEAEHVKLGKRVAIKAIAPQRLACAASVPHFAARLLREGRAAVRLAHPNVVNVFDIAEQDGVPYLVMEFVEGGTLAELLAERAPLQIGELLELFMPLVAAVAHAHRLGIVHRDLKPENCLLSQGPDGRLVPKLADFGVCRSLHDSGAVLTQDQGLLGTLRYMAPEQLRSAKDAGPSADQYSLAVMLYQAATGQSPLVESDPVLLLRRAADGDALLSSTFVNALPPALRPVLVRALASAEGARFPSMHAFGVALLALGNPRTQAEWAHWCSGASSHEASSISAFRVRAQHSGTWDDAAHSMLDAGPALAQNRASSTGSRFSFGWLAVVPIIVASFLVAAQASQGPAEPAAVQHKTMVPAVVQGQPTVIAPADVAPSAAEPVAPSRIEPGPGPRPGVPQERAVPRSRPARRQAVELVQHAQEQQRANTPSQLQMGQLQMGRNGAPILD